MEDLTPEMVGHILSFLSSREMVNCRLVCKSFKCEVDRQLATVTHVLINESGLNQTFIPKLLCPSLTCLHFDCEEDKFSFLFTFLQSKCPKIRFLSASDDRLSLEELFKVSNKLRYFEVADVVDVGHRKTCDLRLMFPCLEAFLVNNFQRPNAFCLVGWSAQPEGPNVKVAKFIQSRDVCCRSCENELTSSNSFPCNTSWYIGRRPFSQNLARQLKDQVTANSLRMLELNIGDISFDFNLPNLTRAKLCFSLCNASNFILNSLRNSPNLQVLFLFFYDMKVQTDELCSLISSLKQLRSLSLTDELNPPDEPLRLSLPPKLVHLYVNGFKLAPQTYSTSVKFAKFFNSASGFNLPNLLECHIEFLLEYSPEVRETFGSLEHSTNLKMLEIKFDVPERFDPHSSPTASIYSFLPRLTKLEVIDIEIFDEVPPVKFEVSNFPNLRFLRWENYGDEGEAGWDICFDQKYESVIFNSARKFTIRSPSGHSIKFDLAEGAKVNFKYPIESTVTKATFLVPNKWPSFIMPQLVECRVILDRNDELTTENSIEALSDSLLSSPQLEVFTLITKTHSRVTLAQLDTLLFALHKLDKLKRLEGIVNLCSRNVPSNVKKGPAKFPSLSRAQHNWQLKLIC